MRVCEDERDETGGASLFVEKRCVEVELVFCRGDGFLE